MTNSAFAKFVADLWYRHGSADKHGYVDLMRTDGFEAACMELRDKLIEDPDKR